MTGSPVRKKQSKSKATGSQVESSPIEEVEKALAVISQATVQVAKKQGTDAAIKAALDLSFPKLEAEVRKGKHDKLLNPSGATIKGLVRALLHDRVDHIRNDRSLKVTYPWTLSTVWYIIEPLLKTLGFEIKDSHREMIQDEYVLDICRYELHITRESIGVYAMAKGVLYYNGKAHLVDIDDLPKLSEFGIYLVVIEKQAPAKAFSNLAKDFGIAILSTGGFFSENHQELSKLVGKQGGHVGVFRDLDSSGLSIALNAAPSGVFDLGLDFAFLEELGLDPDTLKQAGPGETSHWKGLCDHGLVEDEEFLEWLRDYKIEIDNVMKVMPAQKMWDLIMKRLAEKFPSYNLNRAIDVMTNYTEPDFMIDLNQSAESALRNTVWGLDNDIKDEFEDCTDEIRKLDDVQDDLDDRRIEAYESNDLYHKLRKKAQALTDWINKQNWPNKGTYDKVVKKGADEENDEVTG